MTACGYQLGRRGVVLAKVRRVHVPAFENDTKEPGIGVLFARALREELAARGRIRLVDAAQAEVVFEGRVKSYGRSPLSFPTINPAAPGLLRVGEFRTVAVGAVALRRRADNQVLFSSGDVGVTTEFLPGPDVMATEANRDRSLRQLAFEFARRVADLLADSF
jgi:hypothetical protein